jgi:hypothetical protein
MHKAILLAAAAAWASVAPATAQVRDLREMNTDQIRALDRSKTVAIIPEDRPGRWDRAVTEARGRDRSASARMACVQGAPVV